MDPQLSALQSSVERLRSLVEPLSDAQLEQQAYPTEWRIADVLSHLGSGAVITERRLDDAFAGNAMPDDFAPAVWDTWNAKSPRQKADDGLAADRALLDRLVSVTDAEQSLFAIAIGPLSFGFSDFVGLRVNEHGLHTWDIEVALDPAATLHREQVALIIDKLGLIARFTGKPTGTVRTIDIRTTDPARDFVVDLATDSVTLVAGTAGAARVLELPAEAFARLVYGRLDAEHTGVFTGNADDVDELRKVFPGP